MAAATPAPKPAGPGRGAPCVRPCAHPRTRQGGDKSPPDPPAPLRGRRLRARPARHLVQLGAFGSRASAVRCLGEGASARFPSQLGLAASRATRSRGHETGTVYRLRVGVAACKRGQGAVRDAPAARAGLRCPRAPDAAASAPRELTCSLPQRSRRRPSPRARCPHEGLMESKHAWTAGVGGTIAWLRRLGGSRIRGARRTARARLPTQALVRTTTLANGMQVIVWPDHSIPARRR